MPGGRKRAREVDILHEFAAEESAKGIGVIGESEFGVLRDGVAYRLWGRGFFHQIRITT